MHGKLAQEADRLEDHKHCVPLKSSYEPRPCRYPADQLLWLIGRNGSVACAAMTNVSRDGFGLRVKPAPKSGERVILRGGAGDIPAQICWSAGDRAGGIFLRPQDDDS